VASGRADRAVQAAALAPLALDRVLADERAQLLEAGASEPTEPPVRLDAAPRLVVSDIHHEAGIAPGGAKPDPLRLEHGDPQVGAPERELARDRETGETRADHGAVDAHPAVEPARRRCGWEERDPSAPVVVAGKLADAHGEDSGRRQQCQGVVAGSTDPPVHWREAASVE
jgi:hypothetical protein